MPLNLLDIGFITIYIGVIILIIKKSWFYSYYSFTKFLLAFFISFFLARYLILHTHFFPYFSNIQKAIILQSILFTLLWFVLRFKKIFLLSNAKIFDVNRFIFIHHLNKYLNILPAFLISFFVSLLLFTVVLAQSTNHHALQSQIAESTIARKLAANIYFAQIGKTNTGLFDGLLYKLTTPFNSSFALPPNPLNQSIITMQTVRINAQRQSIGLPSVGSHMYTPPPSEIYQQSAPYVAPSPTPEERSIIDNTIRIFVHPTPTTTQSQPPSQNPILPTPTPTSFIPTAPTATSVPVQPTATPTSQPTQPPISFNRSVEETTIFNKTNAERAKNGVSALQWSDEIAVVARAHSVDMATRNFFAHTNPDGVDPFQRLRIGGVTYQTAGENIAEGPNSDFLMTAWMNSPGHRANILNPAFHKIGVGAASSPSYGVIATQNFTN